MFTENVCLTHTTKPAKLTQHPFGTSSKAKCLFPEPATHRPLVLHHHQIFMLKRTGQQAHHRSPRQLPAVSTSHCSSLRVCGAQKMKSAHLLRGSMSFSVECGQSMQSDKDPDLRHQARPSLLPSWPFAAPQKGTRFQAAGAEAPGRMGS